MQVEIDNPHAKAIAAFYSGKRIRCKGSGAKWWRKNEISFAFDHPDGYEIEPEVMVKFTVVFEDGSLSDLEETDVHTAQSGYARAARVRKDVICKKTYTNDVLTALELVKVE